MKHNKQTRAIITSVVFLAFAMLLTLYGPKSGNNTHVAALEKTTSTTSILKQDVVSVYTLPQTIYHVYYKDQEIGKMHNVDLIKPLLERVYQESYQKEFPNSKLNLGEDLHISKESSIYEYENIDEQILDYIERNEYFSVEVTKLTFSNGAEAYVKNLDDFNVAKDKYVMNFITKEAYSNIQNKIPQPELNTYGSRDISISIEETMNTSKGYAPISKILMNVDDIVYYLSYGYDTVPEYYTVKKWDTVEGIAQSHGLEAEHIVMINSKNIKKTDQVLEVGMQVNVTYYNSPITIKVTKEVLRSEPHYPESPQYISDSTLPQGVSRTITPEKVGSDDVRVKEVWINGVLKDNEILSKTVKVAPQRQVKLVGTKVIPGIGTGVFRWPVDYPTITCRWGCYYGHQAIDVQNRYNRYGSIYAADRGTVIVNGYTRVNGNYVKINHGNGFVSYYGHMRVRSPLSVGTKVEKGQVIGTIGMTGVATGPHVHFAIEKNGVRMNPCIYLGC